MLEIGPLQERRMHVWYEHTLHFQQAREATFFRILRWISTKVSYFSLGLKSEAKSLYQIIYLTKISSSSCYHPYKAFYQERSRGKINRV